MEVQVNYLAVFLAMISSMVVGAIWYSKSVFGAQWQKLAKLTDKQLLEGGAKPMVITAVVSLITAYVLAHVTFLSHQFYNHGSFLQDALTTAFWLWLGLTAARIITHNVFEHRPTKLTVLAVAHEFVTLEVMALIIGLMKP